MYWLAAFVVLLIIEIITVGLSTIWFAAGALGAFIASVAGANIWVQIVIFLILSLGMLILLRPVALKYFNQDRVKTNVDSIIGMVGRVTLTIDNVKEEGTVKISGQEWTARSSQDSVVIPKDTRVRIIEVRGVKLIVEVLKED